MPRQAWKLSRRLIPGRDQLGRENTVTSELERKRAFQEGVNELQSGVIPLLASPQGGVAASSKKCRAATEADAAGVVFLLVSSENHPGLAIEGCFAAFYWSLVHPSLR